MGKDGKSSDGYGFRRWILGYAPLMERWLAAMDDGLRGLGPRQTTRSTHE